jgi:hypothetical protein
LQVSCRYIHSYHDVSASSLPGLAIHLLRKTLFKEDGCAGQARA